jgi:hypothetical protein
MLQAVQLMIYRVDAHYATLMLQACLRYQAIISSYAHESMMLIAQNKRQLRLQETEGLTEPSGVALGRHGQNTLDLDF